MGERGENGVRMDASLQNDWKKAAAEAAAQLVQPGMVVGLGTGSTAAYFVLALAQRMTAEGLRIVGIPTSEKTAELARSVKIPLTNFAEHLTIDLTVDGADEIEPRTMALIKGHGGALLREKIVASASRRMVVVGDESKIVDRLGAHESVPVEVVPFGREVTQAALQKMGARTQLRNGPDARPFITDGGNCIVDCTFPPIEHPAELGNRLDHLVGVVEHGLFVGIASQAFIGGREGVKLLEKSPAASH